MTIAPIAIFAFNRPNLLRLTLEALAANDLAEKSHVTFFCDGPRNSVKHPEDADMCEEVRAIARGTSGFASVEIVERVHNLGCANSVINGLTHMFAKHERLIVIEDDILTSPYTLSFLNEGLDRYANETKVFNIGAWSVPPSMLPYPTNYKYDVYCLPRFNCWGWASWKDRFDGIDWEVKNFSVVENSKEIQRSYSLGGDDLFKILSLRVKGCLDTWDIQTDCWRFCNRQYGVYPLIPYTTNIGFGSGTHTTEEDHRYDNNLENSISPDRVRWINEIKLNDVIVLKSRLNYSNKPCFRKIVKENIKFVLSKLHLLNFAKKVKRVLKSFNSTRTV